MTENNRPRGVTVYPITDPAIVGPSEGFDNYALVTRIGASGIEVRMVHTEGVAYEVRDDKPWRWNDYRPCEEFTPAQLIAAVDPDSAVDLADWVRTFGHRLESNFGMIYRWATTEA